MSKSFIVDLHRVAKHLKNASIVTRLNPDGTACLIIDFGDECQASAYVGEFLGQLARKA